MSRSAVVTRETKETRITAHIDLDGTGLSNISTGIGFFDHMLTGFAKHGFFDLIVKAEGDLEVDTHHTVEDVGIVLGTAIRQALGDKAGIVRYGSCILPMDETLMLVSMDLCGRPYFQWTADFQAERIGDLETETIREFFYAISYSAMMNLHIRQMDGINSHHIAEAMFKAFGKALDMAVQKDPRVVGVLSTKGEL